MRILLLMTVFFWSACHLSKKAVNPSPTPEATVSTPVKSNGFVQWDKKMLDLGKVRKGAQSTFFYEFTNISNETVKIEIVDACECTKVDWPRGNIAPGGKARLDVVFDSADKEAAETIGINVVFSNLAPDGNPRIEVVEYKFDLVK
jgi:peptidoglycan-associated lipoprotein